MYSPYFIVKNRVLDGFHNSDIFETDMLLEFCKTTRSICKKTIFFFNIYIDKHVRFNGLCSHLLHPTHWLRACKQQPFGKTCFEIELSLSKKKILICFDDSPPKMMKKAFNFILKALFVLKIFKFLKL